MIVLFETVIKSPVAIWKTPDEIPHEQELREQIIAKMLDWA